MNKICTLLGLAGLVAAPSLHASTVTLTEVGGNANGGGLFQAATSDNGTFDTFCLSIVTSFTPGTPYSYVLSSTINANTPPTGVPTYITAGVAYIYSQFLQGNPDYAGVANANAVQATIWYLQGLLVGPTDKYGVGGVSGGYLDPETGANLESLILPILADTGMTLAQLEANGNGADGIVAMDMFDANGNYAQPQLAPVPEPTTVVAGALLLLPFGVSTLRILRKDSKV